MGVRIYHGLDEVGAGFGPCALTIGNFDGVHIGHRYIFRRVVALARRNGWKPAVLTFDPHPATVVAPERAPKLLSAVAERCEWMAEEGIAQVVILPFTGEFSQLTPEQFAREILAARFSAKAVMVGSNFRFGRRAAGDTSRLRELGRQCGFTTEVIAGISCRGRMVSSSEVRALISGGNVRLGARLLGRPYSLAGSVVPGHGIGSRKTVPTLNLSTNAELIPANGVYVTFTNDLDTGISWPSVTNIGNRPTFDGRTLTIETHLLMPLESAPPAAIRIHFLQRLRREKTFPDAESLKEQIFRDARRARAYFRRAEKWVEGTARSTLETGRVQLGSDDD